jgi:hypothetical protein
MQLAKQRICPCRGRRHSTRLSVSHEEFFALLANKQMASNSSRLTTTAVLFCFFFVVVERHVSPSNVTASRDDRSLTVPSNTDTAAPHVAVGDDAPAAVDPALVQQFASKMSDKERAVLAAMLKRVTDVLDAANLTYYMCGGTLIGSYRHHGMVPWDDDVDIYVRWSDRSRIEAEVRRHMYEEGYRMTKRQTIWKLFPMSANQSSPIRQWSWRYPFVDICFYLEDATTVWDPETRWFSNFRFPRSIVFPLRRRPFMNMSLWAPHDVETYLTMTYGNLSRCSTHHYSHRHERGTTGKVFSVDCRQLWAIHPFVFRSVEEQPSGGASVVLEELRIGKRKLNTVRLLTTS